MKCHECPEKSTQIVDLKNSTAIVYLNLCDAHAAGHRRAARWGRVYQEMREAYHSGDEKRGDELSRELAQIQSLADNDDGFVEFIAA